MLKVGQSLLDGILFAHTSVTGQQNMNTEINGKDCCERQNPQVLGRNSFILPCDYHVKSY